MSDIKISCPHCEQISNGTATGSLKLKAAGKVSVDLKGNFSAAVQ